MSTISDALKKLQTDLEEKKATSNPSTSAPSSAAASESSLTPGDKKTPLPPGTPASLAPLANSLNASPPPAETLRRPVSTIAADPKKNSFIKSPAADIQLSISGKRRSLFLVFSILCLLPIVFVLLLVPVLQRKPVRRLTAPLQSAAPVVERQSPPSPAPEIQPIEEEALLSPPAEPEIKLNGVMITNGKNVALINGNIYEVGDKIRNMEIVNIATDQVQLRKGGEIKTISVKK